MRVLLHPGFHKTGTSSLQRAIIAQADQLAPYLRTLLSPDMIKATRAARRYSSDPTPKGLERFSDYFQTAISTLSPDDPRAVLISSEDLSGYMPGLADVTTYDAAPTLMLAIGTMLRDHFGPRAQIRVWFTTRNAATWLKSLYWQNLRARRLTDDFEIFCPQFAAAAQLEQIVASTREVLGSDIEVAATSLETNAQHRLGPLGTALDLLDLPSDMIPRVGVHNLQPAGGAEALLALNRSSLDDASLKDAKRALLRDLRRNTKA